MKPRLLLLLLCVLIHQPAVASPTTSTEVASTATSAPSLWTPHCASILLDKAQKALGVNVDVQFLVLPADISDGTLQMVNPADVPHSALANVSVQSSGNLSSALQCNNGSDLLSSCDKITLAAREMNITLYRARCTGTLDLKTGTVVCEKNVISCQDSTAKGTPETCNGAPDKLAFVFFDVTVEPEKKCMATSWRLTLLAAAAPTTTTSTTTSKKIEPEKEPTRLPPPPPPDKPDKPKQTEAPPAPPATPPPSSRRPETQPPPTPPETKTTEEEATTDAAYSCRYFEWAVAWWLLWSALF